jgi:hypothetical protein
MLRLLRPRIEAALAAAGGSPLTADLGANRPWLRLASFIALSALLIVTAMIVMAVILMAVPGLEQRTRFIDNLPDTPLRLLAESDQVVFLGVILGAVAVAILTAAALTYRRALAEFLWPGRRFAVSHLWLGFLVMTCITVVLTPVYLLTGSVWDPPVLDPQYLAGSRLIYAAAMVGGLLIAAAAEEVVFRGVFLRLTGRVTRNALLLCLINGVAFSAFHLDPDPVAFIARGIAGAVWTWAALRLGGLEFAIGAHLANNLFIALFWQPFSEASTGGSMHWAGLGFELATALVVVLFVERVAQASETPPGLPARAAA